jgi:hypothetical protein
VGEKQFKSGDGKASASAFVLIATDGESAVLGALGIRPSAQTYLSEKGEKFARMDGLEKKSNERVTQYFNVTKPSTRLEEQMKGQVSQI